MGKKSIREDKNIFQLAREEAGLTRAQASEKLVFVSESRIEEYESGKSEVHPEEVLAMAKAYRKPMLCNYYCSKMCPIGKENVPEIKMKDLNANDIEMATRIIEGSARSMGLEVVEG